jgi:hypothetical protein
MKKIIIGALIILVVMVAVVLFALVGYFLKTKNANYVSLKSNKNAYISGVNIEDGDGQIIQSRYSNDNIDDSIDNNVGNDNVSQNRGAFQNNNTNNRRVVFSDNLLQIKTKQNILATTNIITEDLVNGYNVPAHASYVLEYRQLTRDLSPTVTLDIYNLEDGVDNFLFNNNVNYKYVESLNLLVSLIKNKNINDILDDISENSQSLIFPPANAACFNVRSVKVIDTDFMRGVRYLIYCTQENAPASSMNYLFQGISKDGLKNIVFFQDGVKSVSLEKYYKQNSGAIVDLSSNNIKKTFEILNSEKDENFLPSLLDVDKFLESLIYE